MFCLFIFLMIVGLPIVIVFLTNKEHKNLDTPLKSISNIKLNYAQKLYKTTPTAFKVLMRFFFFLACHAFSVFGIFGLMVAGGVLEEKSFGIINLLMVLAWCCHIWLCVAWIVQAKVPLFVVKGYLFLISGCAIMPFVSGIFAYFFYDMTLPQSLDLVGLGMYGILWLLPCILMGLKAFFFQLDHYNKMG
ncbi:MAG: hypothetical protein U1E94_00300 [Agitococcus sp.]